MAPDRYIDKDFSLEVHALGKAISLPVGLWTVETVTRYETALRSMVHDHRSRGMPLRLLIDLRERSAHSQDVAQALQPAFARIAPSFERIAIVLPRSAIMVLQAKRVADKSSSTGDHQRQFGPDEIAAAHAWLDENPPALSVSQAA